MAKILVVDDEKEICDLVEIYLKNDNFEVVKAYDGAEALRLIDSEQIDLIVLDVMMPEMDGIELCKRVRTQQDIPIIMLSAKSQDMDKIFGLMTGADDYMAKPFNPFELIARIKSQLRRYEGFGKNEISSAQKNEDEVRYSGLYMNKNEHTVTLYEKPLELTPTEFDILWLLSKNEGKV
ncbi:MAG: response regulator transcription factor, partial [Oscillospiraceae bacterium]